MFVADTMLRGRMAGVDARKNGWSGVWPLFGKAVGRPADLSSAQAKPTARVRVMVNESPLMTLPELLASFFAIRGTTIVGTD